MDIAPIRLVGSHILLEPLSLTHLQGLCEVGLDPDLWRWSPTIVRSEQEMRSYVETALRLQQEGTVLPFATVLRANGKVVGSTRFAAIDRSNKRVEIGWTWIARPWQRTGVNIEAKLLMLAHAFEQWECIRVEFKTDSLNAQSRAALKSIGAVEEGTMRNHMIMPGGRLRHSVYYSMTSAEWPLVKKSLLEKLKGGNSERFALSR